MVIFQACGSPLWSGYAIVVIGPVYPSCITIWSMMSVATFQEKETSWLLPQ